MSAAAQGAETNAELRGRRVAMPPREIILPHGSLVDLAQRLEAMKASTRDVVASTKDVAMEVYETPQPQQPGIEPEPWLVRLGIRGEAKDYPLTRHAHAQLAEKTGIPFRYYSRMLETGHAPLAAQNVNAWLNDEPERKLIRIAEGRVRAILSDRYRVLDNYDLALLTAQRAMEQKAQVLEASLTETRMSIKITVPHYQEKIGELTAAQKALFKGRDTHASRPNLDADYVVPGVMVSNSEVGSAAFRVEPFVFRLVCWNGLVGQESLYKVHLGSRMEVGEVVYSDETRRLDDQALWAKVRDVIDATFNPDVFRGFVAKLRGAKNQEIAKPIEVTDAVAKNLSLSDQSKEALLRYFTVEGHTVYGLVQGVTRLAQDYEDPDVQIEMERAAGEILAKPQAVLA